MSGRLEPHYRFLKSLQQRKFMLRHATKDQICILIEIVWNMMTNKKYLMTVDERKMLKPHISTLKILAKCRNVEKAQELLYQLRHSLLRSIVSSGLTACGLQ